MSNSEIGSKRVLRYCFLPAIFVYLFLLGVWGQPAVHPYFDQIGIREAGTLWSHYASHPEPIKTLIGRAMLHFEGPVQFFMLNAYCYAVGDLFPLNPATMQFPNTVLAWVAVFLAYLLGRRLVSERAGYLCALLLALSPWLGETIRVPWYFNTVSVVLHFAVFYLFLRLMETPEEMPARVLAPSSLAVYVLTGMDWPSFLFSFGVFVLLSGRTWNLLKNPYNCLPAAALLIQVLWPIALVVTGRDHLVKGTMLLYPFFRYGDLAANPDVLQRVVDHVLLPWGVHLPLAVVGLGLYVMRERRTMFGTRPARAMGDALCVWFLGASYGLLSSSTSSTYLYVIALPTVVFAALAFERVRFRYIAVVSAAMIVMQVYVASGRDLSFRRNDDRRILAAAAFLIERRPDLLDGEKTAFLPRNAAAGVGQYARGRNHRIVMPKNFPAELRKHSIGSDEKILHAFVQSYNQSGRIAADWLILDTELFENDVAARDFYLRLKNDPHVKWIARFRDKSGGELALGEVRRDTGAPYDFASDMDTAQWSRVYSEKYDRISFLKRNVEYVDHY